MTKYILNSGNIRRDAELRKKFHQELVKDLGASPNIMLCFFAQGREYWEAKFESYAQSIIEDMPEAVKPTFTLAMPDSFSEQAKAADALVIHGGDDHLVRYWLQNFDIPNLFKGKVVAGSSAGSGVLVRHFWTCDWRNCADGLGIIPIKFIPHFGSDFGDADPRGPIDWQAAHDELAAYGDTTLPIHAPEEGHFIVFSV